MKLTEVVYEEIRGNMRQELVRLQRRNASLVDIHEVQKRLSRLDMAWARGEDYGDD